MWIPSCCPLKFRRHLERNPTPGALGWGSVPVLLIFGFDQRKVSHKVWYINTVFPLVSRCISNSCPPATKKGTTILRGHTLKKSGVPGTQMTLVLIGKDLLLEAKQRTNGIQVGIPYPKWNFKIPHFLLGPQWREVSGSFITIIAMNNANHSLIPPYYLDVPLEARIKG